MINLLSKTDDFIKIINLRVFVKSSVLRSKFTKTSPYRQTTFFTFKISRFTIYIFLLMILSFFIKIINFLTKIGPDLLLTP